MGLITTIAEKAAVTAATAACPPLGWALKALGWIEGAWRWWFGNAVRALLTVLAAVILLAWHVIDTKDATIARLTAEAAKIREEQQVATDNQIHINQLPAITSAAIARQSDAQAPAYYASVAGAAAAHDRVVRSACPASPAGAASLPGPDQTAAVDDGPAATAVMVSRPKADDDLIVAAAARGAKMHQDALDLIAAGDAVADGPIAPVTPSP